MPFAGAAAAKISSGSLDNLDEVEKTVSASNGHWKARHSLFNDHGKVLRPVVVNHFPGAVNVDVRDDYFAL